MKDTLYNITVWFLANSDPCTYWRASDMYVNDGFLWVVWPDGSRQGFASHLVKHVAVNIEED